MLYCGWSKILFFKPELKKLIGNRFSEKFMLELNKF